MKVFTPLSNRFKPILEFVIGNYNSVVHLEKWELVVRFPEDDQGLVIWDYEENYGKYSSQFEVLIFIPLSKEFELMINSDSSYNRLNAQNYRFREDEFLSLFPVDRNSVHAAAVKSEHVIFNIDIIAQQFFLLSGYDEIHSPKDLLGRTTYKGSLIEYFKLWSRALADEGYLLLIHAVHSIGIPESIKLHDGYVWKLSLTHDIDHLKKYTLGFLLRNLLSEKIRNGKSILSVVSGHFKSLFSIDPYTQSIYELLAIAEKKKIKPIFFLRSGKSDKRDSQIDYKSDVVRHLEKLSETGKISVGIHPSIKSSSDLHQMENDWNEFAKYFKNHSSIVRQHFLMYDVKQTPGIHESIKYETDFTLGFHDHEGFRRSTVRPFFAFDFQSWKITGVSCVPLIVMDVTFQDYHRMSLGESINRTKILLDEVSKYQGHVSLLIHNSYSQNEDSEWLGWYQDIIDYAQSKYGWLGR